MRANNCSCHCFAYVYIQPFIASIAFGNAPTPGRIKESTLILLEKGDELEVNSVISSNFLLISGKPIGEQIARGGPFVMNTKSEILQAVQDYHNGTFVK